MFWFFAISRIVSRKWLIHVGIFDFSDFRGGKRRHRRHDLGSPMISKQCQYFTSHDDFQLNTLSNYRMSKNNILVSEMALNYKHALICCSLALWHSVTYCTAVHSVRVLRVHALEIWIERNEDRKYAHIEYWVLGIGMIDWLCSSERSFNA